MITINGYISHNSVHAKRKLRKTKIGHGISIIYNERTIWEGPLNNKPLKIRFATAKVETACPPNTQKNENKSILVLFRGIVCLCDSGNMNQGLALPLLLLSS